MPEQVQNIINRIVEFWRGLSLRQRVLIISSTAVVLVAGGILIFVMTRPTMTELITAEDTEEAAQVQSVLESAGITYELSNGGLTYTVNEKDVDSASLALGSAGIPSKGYDISDVLDGSFSTTEADKKKKYQVYLEEKFATQLATIDAVKEAEVTLSIPDDDGTLIADTKESYANVILTLSDSLDKKTAAGIAKYIATGLGNDSTDNITILDSEGNSIFIGGEDSFEEAYEEPEEDSTDIAERNEKLRRDREEKMTEQVKNAFSQNNGGRAMFDNVEVSINLDMDFDNKSSVDYHYYQDNEDKAEGYLDSESSETTTTIGGVAGTPGTDSNDDSTYVLEDNATETTTSSTTTKDYLPSETITTTEGALGKTNYESSSVSVIAYNNVIYNEDRLEAAGQLEDTTFEEFVMNNSDQVKIDVDEELVQAVANATGIPVENVSVVAYEVPMFQYSDSEGFGIMDILQIVLAVLVFALLGFVVFMSLRREKEEEEEVAEEVTVEDLLEAQEQLEEEEAAREREEQLLEGIEYSDKSESRIVIEKFVDEKPEAAAALLRNWLNEDWA